MNPWLSALVFLGMISVGIGAVMLGARLLAVRPRYTSVLRNDTYECGEEPDGTAWIRFHPRYFVVALVFVLFDVEAAFMLPWALNIADLGAVALIDMAIFLGVLLLGWVYALKKGALKWQ